MQSTRFRPLVIGLGLVFLSGCASHSQRAAAVLDGNKPEAQTASCQEAVKKAEVQDTIKSTRVILSIGLIESLKDLGLETYDQVDAATIAESCGGEIKSIERIAIEMGGTAALGLVSGGTLGGSAGDAGRASVGR